MISQFIAIIRINTEIIPVGGAKIANTKSAIRIVFFSCNETLAWNTERRTAIAKSVLLSFRSAISILLFMYHPKTQVPQQFDEMINSLM